MMAGHTTATAMDIFNALSKRMTTEGFRPSDAQLQTLTLDVMNVINTDAANATSHAATEIATNPPRKFVTGV